MDIDSDIHTICEFLKIKAKANERVQFVKCRMNLDRKRSQPTNTLQKSEGWSPDEIIKRIVREIGILDQMPTDRDTL